MCDWVGGQRERSLFTAAISAACDSINKTAITVRDDETCGSLGDEEKLCIPNHQERERKSERERERVKIFPIVLFLSTVPFSINMQMSYSREDKINKWNVEQGLK